MTLQELLNIIDKFKLKHQDNNVKVNSTKDTRITRKTLLDSNMSIIAEKEMSDGKISVFEDGHVLYEDMDNYTILLYRHLIQQVTLPIMLHLRLIWKTSCEA